MRQCRSNTLWRDQAGIVQKNKLYPDIETNITVAFSMAATAHIFMKFVYLFYEKHKNWHYLCLSIL